VPFLGWFLYCHPNGQKTAQKWCKNGCVNQHLILKSSFKGQVTQAFLHRLGAIFGPFGWQQKRRPENGSKMASKWLCTSVLRLNFIGIFAPFLGHFQAGFLLQPKRPRNSAKMAQK